LESSVDKDSKDHSKGDLHNLGRMFLTSKFLVVCFDIAVMLHLYAML